MKFALLSLSLPPYPDGQAKMLGRILARLDPAEYCLISRNALGLDGDAGVRAERLPARYYSLGDEFLTRDPLWLRRLKTPFRVFALAFRLARIVRAENCRCLVACTGYVFDPPAALFASWLTGVPLHLYFFDDYIYKFYGVSRLLARCFEPLCLAGATRIVAVNEFLLDQMRRRYGQFESLLIYNPCDFPRLAAGAFRPVSPDAGEITILFTGSLYEAHYDAFRNLVAAIALLRPLRLRLHLYTPQPRERIEAEGIAGPVVFHPHRPAAEMAAIQQAADLLFLPLAFSTPYPQLIRVSSPSKMGEYLASGRPIVVHAPPDSFLTWYFQRRGCGVVVDQPSAAQLAAALRRLIADPVQQENLSRRARRCADEDFAVGGIQARFASLVQAPGAAPLPDEHPPII